MTKEDMNKIRLEIADLEKKLHNVENAEFIEEVKELEKKYLHKYFKNAGGTLFHPISVLTPECPYQIWVIALNLNPQYDRTPYHGIESKGKEFRYLLQYEYPFSCLRIPEKYLSSYTEITKEEFDTELRRIFNKVYEDIHTSFSIND